MRNVLDAALATAVCTAGLGVFLYVATQTPITDAAPFLASTAICLGGFATILWNDSPKNKQRTQNIFNRNQTHER